MAVEFFYFFVEGGGDGENSHKHSPYIESALAVIEKTVTDVFA